MLWKEYQEHEGAKDGNTLYVQYNYDDTLSGGEYTQGMRLKSVRYPNTRLVHYTYGSSGSIADRLSRLDAIKDDNGGTPYNTLSAYSYNGAGRLVVEDYPQPEVRLDYWGQTADTYAGFDRFGRVTTQLWRYHGGNPADRDKYAYGYDRNSNPVWKQNTVVSGKDELYGHDSLNRLAGFQRGTLNGNKDGITGTPAREQTWTLDPVGNWSAIVSKVSGNNDTPYDGRTHNGANEITAITPNGGDLPPSNDPE